jgi:nitrous oxidase accessory protein NosD
VHKIAAPVLSIVVTCLLVSTLAISVNGAALNVSSGGQYKSITEAINAAQPGDTITISAGTYTENVIVTKSVTIKAAVLDRLSSPRQIRAKMCFSCKRTTFA